MNIPDEDVLSTCQSSAEKSIFSRASINVMQVLFSRMLSAPMKMKNDASKNSTAISLSRNSVPVPFENSQSLGSSFRGFLFCPAG